jgi:hypothetical protein
MDGLDNHLCSDVNKKGKRYPRNEFLEGGKNPRYCMDAKPAGHRHCELKKSVDARYRALAAPSHAGLCDGVDDGNGKSVHRQSNAQEN